MRFDLFSKRNKPLPDVFQYDDLPPRFRQQVLWLWADTIREFDRSDQFSGTKENEILDAVRKIVCVEHGLASLSGYKEEIDDVCVCVLKSTQIEIVLDIIECSVRGYRAHLMDQHQRYGVHVDESKISGAIATLNHRFRENGVGFEFNEDCFELIRVDNLAIHRSAVQPALAILAGPEYKHANQEILEAFDDYKKGDYDDCLIKCCAAMESVLKIIHKKKNWQYSEKDTAAPLITSYVKNSGLDPFFDQPLMIIATLRNRLSTAHGQGNQPKNVPEHLARYALNATTSAILLLHEHAK